MAYHMLACLALPCRYLLRSLHMALPTADCLCLVLQLLTPVIEAHDDNNDSLTAREVGEFFESRGRQCLLDIRAWGVG